jgi:hypothetical protein
MAPLCFPSLHLMAWALHEAKQRSTYLDALLSGGHAAGCSTKVAVISYTLNYLAFNQLADTTALRQR